MKNKYWGNYSDADIERFWNKVLKKDNGCWEWVASKSSSGYGQFCINGKLVTAHRWIYGVLFHPIENNIQVCHSCDNPSCVNPSHLWEGTKSDNMRDCSAKRRNIIQKHPERSHLKGDRFKRVCGEKQGNSKLTAEQVKKIINMKRIGSTSAELSRMFGVSDAHIRKIYLGKAWKHIQPQAIKAACEGNDDYDQ